MPSLAKVKSSRCPRLIAAFAWTVPPTIMCRLAAIAAADADPKLLPSPSSVPAPLMTSVAPTQRAPGIAADVSCWLFPPLKLVPIRIRLYVNAQKGTMPTYVQVMLIGSPTSPRLLDLWRWSGDAAFMDTGSCTRCKRSAPSPDYRKIPKGIRCHDKIATSPPPPAFTAAREDKRRAQQAAQDFFVIFFLPPSPICPIRLCAAGRAHADADGIVGLCSGKTNRSRLSRRRRSPGTLGWHRNSSPRSAVAKGRPTPVYSVVFQNPDRLLTLPQLLVVIQ
jgi:hypothetical protein